MTEALTRLIPHRPPMLLLHRLVSVSGTSSVAEIDITPDVPFFSAGKGVPGWIGIEYMGQTAALIAGYQLQQGMVEPHLGMLLGTRKYTAHKPWFLPGVILQVSCQEVAVVGQELATFACEIRDKLSGQIDAEARLSVYRRPPVPAKKT